MEGRLSAAAAIDWEMSPEERTTLLYQAGYLDWKIRDYQLADHEAFCTWDAERQTQEHLDEAAAAGALYDNMWVDECGRRYGKTAQWLIRDVNAAIRRPGARGLIACAYQKNIGEIIVPLTKVLFRDAPPGYFPEYRGTHGADHECLIIPATESIIKLVGVDVHPKAIRGQWLDFCHLSEAAFIRNLRELVTSDIMPMFQDRPWAWMALESSTALTRDCEFNTEFREDAKKRGTYRKHTIRDNTHLTEEQIAKEERRSGGKGTANCQRELYCEEAREEKLMVVPEFDVARHVKPANQNAMPAHAHCYVSMDPGEQDPLGIIWGFYDFQRAKLVIQRSFAKSNCRTGEAAQVIKETEAELWGTKHRGMPENMRRDNAVRAQPLLTIADAVRTAGGLVWEPPAAALTYWDHGANQFLPNPYKRVSDIDARMVGDLAVEHSVNFEKTAKDDQYAQESALRHAFAMDWIEIWEPEGHLARQLESGMWQLDTHGRRRDWMTTPSLGHLDCVAALIYLWRNLQREKNPAPPSRIDQSLHGYALPVGVDKDTATGRPGNSAETQFRNSPAVRRWR
jgi:hypothetical protein